MPDTPDISEHVEAIALADGRTFRRDEHDPDAWVCEMTVDGELGHTRIHRMQMRVNLLLAAGMDPEAAMATAKTLEGVA